MNSYHQPTVPNPALQPEKKSAPGRQAVPPKPPQLQRAPLPQRGQPKKGLFRWWMLIPAAGFLLALFACGMLTLGVGLVYGSGILPGVQVGEIDLGGYSQEEAVSLLQSRWNTLLLRDQERSWPVNAAALGITLDAVQTAERAYAQGRGEGGALQAVIGKVTVDPVIVVDSAALESLLSAQLDRFDQAPVNAGVRFAEGRAQATAAQDGRRLNVAATVDQVRLNPALVANGELPVVMDSVQPEVIDSSPMLAEAERLLSSPLDIRIFDPVTGDSVFWSLAPEQWGNWLSAVSNTNSPTGLSLTIDTEPVRNYLAAQAANTFDPTRGIDVEQGVVSVRQAVESGRLSSAFVQVRHQPRTHIVQPGESITSIAWDYDIPYPYIQEANGGLSEVSAGQTINLPAADRFLLKPVVPDKRIVVSISQQKLWAYEDGALKWAWSISTGIPDSPTWPGVYQILSHESNAYAGNWNLYMPNFMGVYQPIPGADFTNGFHGFPTRGGGQLLWENSIGQRVTYGCILVSNTNMILLYQWAEEGVVVEIDA